MWQDPLEIIAPEGHLVKSLFITAPYGRFGNNFYQIANAAVVASQSGLKTLRLPKYEFSSSNTPFSVNDMIVTETDQGYDNEGVISGQFYVPFGLEYLFENLSTKTILDIIRPVTRTYYQKLIEDADAERAKILVAHFRGGDIFKKESSGHPWYVQPPAAYYSFAIQHALAHDKYDAVRLVSEDKTNPALNSVIEFLDKNCIHFHFKNRGLKEDICSLISASCIISSTSTFTESTALLSHRLKRFYSFRSHNSQTDFAPFMQSRTGEALSELNVSSFIVDDSSCLYMPQKTWTNSIEQRDQIVSFKMSNLRIYASHIPKGKKGRWPTRVFNRQPATRAGADRHK